MNTRTTDIGVIVGRFQTARLHEAHIDLIKTVCERHAKVIIILGLSAIVATKNNPLDFAMRKRMIEDALVKEDALRHTAGKEKIFQNVSILYINDNPSDEAWSANLDRILSDPHQVGTGKTITLYGSRDSFLATYKGRHRTEELIPESTVSATEMRRLSGNRVQPTQDFREGVVWATQNRYATSFPTVDIAVIDRKTNRLLLGRKPNEQLLRFIGGFAEPKDATYEQSAARELEEEAGLKIANLTYIGSALINDWRYRGEVDKIKTIFFLAEFTYGEAKAGDDIAATKWVSLDLGMDLKNLIVKEHAPLVDLLMKHLGNA